jgi:hypothetical protein
MFDDSGADDRWWWQLAAIGFWFSPFWALLPAWAGLLAGATRGNWIAAALIITPIVTLFTGCVYATFFTGYSNAEFGDNSRRRLYRELL